MEVLAKQLETVMANTLGATGITRCVGGLSHPSGAHLMLHGKPQRSLIFLDFYGKANKMAINRPILWA